MRSEPVGDVGPPVVADDTNLAELERIDEADGVGEQRALVEVPPAPSASIPQPRGDAAEPLAEAAP